MGLIYKCKLFYRKQRQRFYGVNSICRKIVPADELGEKTTTIHFSGNVSVYFPPIYNIAPENEIDCYLPELNLMKYQNAIIYPKSDMIILDKGVVWHKYYSSLYSALIPQDVDLFKEKDGRLFSRKPVKIIHVEKGFSLCGVYNFVWSHFLVLYLPKLYYLAEKNERFKEGMTVIIPKFRDTHIREVIQHCMKCNPTLSLLELGSGETAKCDNLYHIDNMSFLLEAGTVVIPSTMIFPSNVYELLNRNLIQSLASKNTNKEPVKLYIERTGVRNLLNRDEVETYFKQQGYLFVSPHKLSLKDKIDLFGRASVVVGACSSGFMNLMFSRKGTKALIYINLARSFEAYLGYIMKKQEIDTLLITGTDENAADGNSSYTIPLRRIKAACEQLGI